MKSQRTIRLTALCSVVSAVLLTILAVAYAAAASTSLRGNTGQALTLRAALRGGTTASLLSSNSRLLFDTSPFVPAGRTRNGRDGRFIYDKNFLSPMAASKPRATGATILINEAVQTFDVFAPPPAFAPVEGRSLNPTNLTPVWSLDERTIVFSSNRDADGTGNVGGRFHIWTISANGGRAVQVTSGSGNEFFPALNSSNNQLAFTSDANSPGVQNLYTLNFGPGQGTTNVANLNNPNNSKTLRSDLTVGFDQVQRPTWSPDGDRIAFSARTTSDSANVNRNHIYYLYSSTNGFQSSGTANNPPAKLTDGPSNDTDPAWSPDGRFIAFASTATGFSNTNQPLGPGTSPSISTSVAATRSVFMVTSSGQIAPGALSATAGRVTLAGQDTFGPAWSVNDGNQYTNPNVAFLYLAFARGATPASPHDIYYFRAIDDANTGSVTPETTSGAQTPNTAVRLNTSDPGNVYNDVYPTWAAFQSIFSIAYASNRSVTYNNPANNAPVETAISLASGSGIVGGGYVGILESQVLNLNPPTLLRFNGTEVVHVNLGRSPILPGVGNQSGSAVKEVQPGQPVTLTVRLSNREAGTDPNRVFLQIKDPDSKYQDQQLGGKGVEHKVFTSDPTENKKADGRTPRDSGSASYYAHNGGIGGGALRGFNTIGDVTYRQIGVIGGRDGGDTISVGSQGGTRESSPPYYSIGQEYECQYINPTLAPGINPTANEYGSPYYLAGVDDQQAFSGFNPANTKPPTIPGEAPPYSHPPRPSTGTSAEYLKLTRAVVQDALGGVLYTATFNTPPAASDFFVDVIAYDKAAFPALPGSTSIYDGTKMNWRIYDNVSGFTSQPFNGGNDILVVSDNALGQKFALSTFGGQQGLANVAPTLYGAESYVTDIDVAYLPDSVYFQKSVNSAPVAPIIQPLGFGASPRGSQGSFRVLNGLGVGSYTDGIVNDTGTSTDGFSRNKSQLYSIWRVLSRGPISRTTLLNFAPTFQSQPAVSNPVTGFKAVAGARVPVAQKCVIWLSPFTGDLLVGPGSLDNPTTQNDLRAFVNAGGRLCVSGQDVGSTLTNNGAINNAKGSFLYDILNATLKSSDGGTQQLAGAAARGNRITYDSYFNVNPNIGVSHDYFQLNSSAPIITYHAPGESPLFISNNYIESGNPAISPLWRTDGSLDQIGPYFATFSLLGFNSSFNVVLGQIDTITPQNGARNDVTFNGPAVQNERPGDLGLVYKENVGPNGGRTVYASFGLEGLGIEYYKVTIGQSDNFVPRNNRPNILHNIVSYLRTGSVTGKVVQTTGQDTAGVQGATVYLIANEGVPIPGQPANRQTFSAITGPDGKYRIDGVEPGAYIVATYKTGFTNTQSTAAFIVESDTVTRDINLNISPLPAGSISGRVTDGANPVSGATVRFTSQDGLTTVVGVTGPDGTYTIANVPAGTYTGFASKSPQFSDSPPKTITVSSGRNTPNVDFVVTPGGATISGRVLDKRNNAPISGALVTFKNARGVLVGGTTTRTKADGTYTSPKLPAGTYTVTASATNFAPASRTVTVAAGANLTGIDFLLGPLGAGTLGGLVKDGANGNPLGGAVVQLLDATNTVIASLPTTSTTRTGPDGLPVNYLGTVKQGSYTARLVKGGYVSVTQNVTVQPNTFTRLDFTGTKAPQSLHNFDQGYNFFSVPYDYTQFGSSIFDQLFGPLNTGTKTSPSSGSNRSHVAVWNPVLVQYVLDPTPPADALRLGQGYWVYLQNPVGLSVVGTRPSSASIPVALRPDWNMIGVPSLTAIPLSSLTFTTNGATDLSFADATSPGFHLVDPTLYRYDKGSRTYQAVTVTDTDGKPGMLQPYQAYWIRAFVPVTVKIPTQP